MSEKSFARYQEQMNMRKATIELIEEQYFFLNE